MILKQKKKIFFFMVTSFFQTDLRLNFHVFSLKTHPQIWCILMYFRGENGLKAKKKKKSKISIFLHKNEKKKKS